MTKVNITHFKADDCSVCTEMKDEIKSLKKKCGSSCKIRVVDIDKTKTDMSKFTDKEGYVMVPITRIKKGKQYREFEGYMTQKDLMEVINEDW